MAMIFLHKQLQWQGDRGTLPFFEPCKVSLGRSRFHGNSESQLDPTGAVQFTLSRRWMPTEDLSSAIKTKLWGRPMQEIRSPENKGSRLFPRSLTKCPWNGLRLGIIVQKGWMATIDWAKKIDPNRIMLVDRSEIKILKETLG